jgi:hypothetical protein
MLGDGMRLPIPLDATDPCGRDSASAFRRRSRSRACFLFWVMSNRSVVWACASQPRSVAIAYSLIIRDCCLFRLEQVGRFIVRLYGLSSRRG